MSIVQNAELDIAVVTITAPVDTDEEQTCWLQGENQQEVQADG